MGAFENASGISAINMNYFFSVVLVVITIIGVCIGFIDLLRVVRSGQLEGANIIGKISTGVAAIIAVIAMVYFISL